VKLASRVRFTYEGSGLLGRHRLREGTGTYLGRRGEQAFVELDGGGVLELDVSEVHHLGPPPDRHPLLQRLLDRQGQRCTHASTLEGDLLALKEASDDLPAGTVGEYLHGDRRWAYLSWGGGARWRELEPASLDDWPEPFDSVEPSGSRHVVSKPLLAARMDGILDRTFGVRLKDVGFEGLERRMWVRQGPPEMRQVVSIVEITGRRFVPPWGLCLSFVPHVEGRVEVRWHRSGNQVLTDLGADPIDFDGDQDVWSVPSLTNRVAAERKADEVAARTLGEAGAWFDQVTDLPSLLAAFRRAEVMPTHRFGFDSYPQQRLAMAFTLAHLGEAEAARSELARWAEEQTALGRQALAAPEAIAHVERLLEEQAQTRKI
jgi:hypothetical protein